MPRAHIQIGTEKPDRIRKAMDATAEPFNKAIGLIEKASERSIKELQEGEGQALVRTFRSLFPSQKVQRRLIAALYDLRTRNLGLHERLEIEPQFRQVYNALTSMGFSGAVPNMQLLHSITGRGLLFLHTLEQEEEKARSIARSEAEAQRAAAPHPAEA